MHRPPSGSSKVTLPSPRPNLALRSFGVGCLVFLGLSSGAFGSFSGCVDYFEYHRKHSGHTEGPNSGEKDARRPVSHSIGS